MKDICNRIVAFFADLKLTVTLLTLLAILVFIATLDQVNLGIYFMTQKYFSGLWVWWEITNGFSIPVFPSGLTIGALLFVNLLVAHFTRFKWKIEKVGIWLIHLGLLTLIVGATMTKFLATETQMILKEGSSKNFIENQRETELVFIRKESGFDDVTAISTKALKEGNPIIIKKLPFTVTPQTIFENTQLSMNPILQNQMSGLARRLTVDAMPLVMQDNKRNTPAILLEINHNGSVSKWWVSTGLNWHQPIEIDGETYWMILRYKREYLNVAFYLEDFSHDVYPGTTVPKNFSSDIKILNEKNDILETAHIYMNHPLRYEGRTYYQSSYAENNTVSVLQVVENPSWIFPYLSTLIMAIGLSIHFLIHLKRFLRKGSIK